MALAVIHLEDGGPDRQRFRIDIGKNRYYSYAIGEKAYTQPNGLRLLDDPVYASRIAGPLPDESLGRGLLEVPSERFDRKNRYIQLMSFRTAQCAGPALSDILPVPPSVTAEADLPDIALSFSPDEVSSHSGGNGRNPELIFGMEVHVNLSNTPTVPFRYREPAWSEPMFLQGLLSALPGLVNSALPALGKILPTAGKLLGSLTGGAAPAAAVVAAPAPGGDNVLLSQIVQTISNPETMRAVLDVIKNVLSSPASIQSQGLSVRSEIPNHRYSQTAEYSRALIAPALLAALPALMPIIGKVLNPETLKALNPAIAGSEINLKQQQQLFEHLRQITPQVGSPEMDKLFEGLSLGHAYGSPITRCATRSSTNGKVRGKSYDDFKPVDSVEVHFAEQAPLMLDGRQRLLYHAGQALAFPLTLNTPKPIANAELIFQVKDPESLKVLIEQKTPLSNVVSGRLAGVPRLEASQVQALIPNEDYLVCACLVWRSKSGDRLGSQRSHLVTLIGEYAFDRVETTEEIVPLNDVEKFRDFWHKVWQDSFTDNIRRRFFDVKYYYTLERDRKSNARLETEQILGQGGGPRDQTGRMRAGLINSPFALNELLPVISSYPSLGQAELTALLAADFATHFRYAARSKVRFTGKNGDSAALWVFPELRLNRVILQQAVRMDGNGHVQELVERVVHFPMPAFAHFVGVRTP